MKKIITVVLAISLISVLVVGCSNKNVSDHGQNFSDVDQKSVSFALKTIEERDNITLNQDQYLFSIVVNEGIVKVTGNLKEKESSSISDFTVSYKEDTQEVLSYSKDD